jgi:ATP-dependent Clp protease adapter protein ClpS
MIAREYNMPNPAWLCSELECEKSGVKLQKLTSWRKSDVIYKVVDGEDHYDIMEEVFEIIKKILI